MADLFNPKIPILMYHEVSKVSKAHDKCYSMTPLYDIPIDMFESQLMLFAQNGYKTLLFDDVLKIKQDEKYIILTFDDGLKGNYRYVFPILNKYGFKATFFVTTGAIGSERYMNWSELKELVDNGMSIQSHTMSHKPLQTLYKEDIYRELFGSKETIERMLKTKVTAISFPHGSYNLKIVSMAKEIGYKWMCTSNIAYVYYNTFKNGKHVLGRITITNKMKLDNLLKIINYDRKEMMKYMLVKNSKNMFKWLIGIENYRWLYKKFFHIK